MEEDLLPVPTFKLYGSIAIRIGTFLGGPLATGYLMAENFKQLGQEDKITNTWVISIIATLLVCTLSVLLSKDFPYYIIPIIIYAGIASYLVQRFQGVQIKLHIEEVTHRGGWSIILSLGSGSGSTYWIVTVSCNVCINIYCSGN